MSDDLLRAQLKLSLEVLSNTLSFLASPFIAETLRRFCSDREFYETLRRATSAVQALEKSCRGATRFEMVKKMISEVRRCPNIECARRVVDEYEELLDLAHT